MRSLREGLFAETPSGLRALVMLLYALVGPVFSTILWFQGDLERHPASFVAVVVLIGLGFLWLVLRPTPRTIDWIFPVAISPTLCCGIAFVACGVAGPAYMGVLGAPLAWSAVLFDAPVVLVAWITATGTCFAVTLGGGAPSATANSVLFATILGLVAWVVYGKASRLRVARAELQASAARAQALLRTLPHTIARVDRDGRFLDVHAPIGDALPLPADELVGRRVFDLVPPEIAERMRSAIERAFSSEQPQTVEYAVDYGPELRRFETYLARSGPDELVVIRRDVTARHRAQADQRFLAALVEHMQEAVVTVDLDLRITHWSGGAEAVYGWKADEVLGRPVRPLLAPELPEAEASRFAANLAAVGADRAVARQQRKDGTAITIDSRVAALMDEHGKVHGFLAVCRDVTAQRAAERALRASEDRYRSVVAATGEGIVMREADGVISAVNPAAERLLGIDARQMQGLAPIDPRWQLVGEDGCVLPIEERPNRAALRTGRAMSNVVIGIRKPDGSMTWLSVNSQPLFRGDAEKPYAVVATYRDVTQERAAAAALANSEERLRAALNAADTFEWDWDLVGDLIRMGSGWGALVGDPDVGPLLTGPAWKARVHPDDLVAMWSDALACARGQLAAFDAQYRLRCAGGWRWFRSRGRVTVRDEKGRALRAVGTLSDVTQLHELQEKLLAATRLASVGTLAAGVAHEINNPLAWISSNLNWVQERLQEAPDGFLAAPKVEELRQVLAEASEGTARIAAIVKAMRCLGRPEQPGEAEEIDVRKELLDAIQIVRNQIVQRAALHLDIPERLPLARARTSELGRVFLNLLVNAAQAVPDGQATLQAVTVRARSTGLEVVVEVADTGAGITPEIAARIFDPFFTTKPVGIGTGLGLTIARSIVEGAGGTIEFESEAGRGSTFRVVLPSVEGARASEAAQSGLPAPRSLRRRVLVIDDEPLVARAVQRSFAPVHDVTVTTSAAEALRLLDGGERFDAILCDLMMPDFDGVDFYAAVAAGTPEHLRRLAFITGGVFGDRSTRFLAAHDVVTVPKPLEMSSLLRVIEELAAA